MTNGLAVVTGASSGMGAEFARQLAARGHDLLLVARRAHRLHELNQELKDKHGRAGHVLVLDLTMENAARHLRERADAIGPTAVLVNNAGYGTYGEFAKIDGARETAMIRLNCEALTATMRAFLPAMLERRAGTIINVASLASFQPVPWMATYAATKAFVLSLTEAVAEEVRGSGVTVSAICPGPVETEFFEVAHPGKGGEMRRPPGQKKPPAVVAAALKAAEAGRVVRVPGLIAKTLVFSGRLSPRAIVRRVSGSTVKPR